MQKTLTIRGKRYTGKQIAAMMSSDNMTKGEDYIVTLNGSKHYANYRQVQDSHFSPTCNEDAANAIALMPDDGSYKWSIWVEYP